MLTVFGGCEDWIEGGEMEQETLYDNLVLYKMNQSILLPLKKFSAVCLMHAKVNPSPYKMSMVACAIIHLLTSDKADLNKLQQSDFGVPFS